MLQTSVSAYVCVFNASYCTSMLTPANRASLGEPLQTLSELVTERFIPRGYWGEPKRAPLLRVGRLPAYASGVDIYIWISPTVV